MKQVILHNYETFKESADKFEAWCKAGCGGLCFVARPFGREPYVLSADAVLDQAANEEEYYNIFRKEMAETKERIADGKATGIDFANLITCLTMLEGESDGCATRIETCKLIEENRCDLKEQK